jgi:thiamine pyrophosphokinase
MSSHHIVREAQEPALIIANGEQCSSDLLSQLLEWSPFIVVLDGALKRVLDLQIKFDVLLGDFDHQTIDEIQAILPPHSEIIHTPDQVKTDLEKGLDYLIQKNHKAVNIVWATGRRSDHYLNNISILSRYAHVLNIVMLDDYSRIYPIKSGFKKHYKANANISLMPLGKVENLTTDNLIWECQNLTIEFPHSSSSCNRVKNEGVVSVTFDSGTLLMMECIDL